MAEYRWAAWLADALRMDPVVAPRVIEVDGWQSRGRPPELGFSFLPSGIVEHHTACMIRDGHDPQSCLNGILAGNGLAPPPVSQLLGTFTKPGTRWTGTNPDPYIIVVAAGRANHAGSGEYPWGAPAGNGSAIGVEWCGPPEAGWPDAVVEFREHVTAAILRWNGWTTRQVTTHWEYVQPVRPTAKIDPSGAWYAEPTLTQTEHWDPTIWRDMVAATLNPPIPPTPPLDEEDDMPLFIARDDGKPTDKDGYRGYLILIGDGKSSQRVRSAQLGSTQELEQKFAGRLGAKLYDPTAPYDAPKLVTSVAAIPKLPLELLYLLVGNEQAESVPAGGTQAWL